MQRCAEVGRSLTLRVRADWQVLPVSKADTISAILPVPEFRDDEYLIMLTRKGQIKRTPLSQFASITSRGLTAIKLAHGDKLCWVGVCTSRCAVFIAASNGKAIHFRTDDDQLRPMGRTAEGNKVRKPTSLIRPLSFMQHLL